MRQDTVFAAYDFDLVFQENSTDLTNKWCSPGVLKIRNGTIDYK